MEQNAPLILIVDDSPTQRLILSAALKKIGIAIEEAEDGAKALALLANLKPDAILLDVEMPGMNGFEVCEEIRKMVPHRYTPIMMVTGLDDYESINQAFLAGATDFATKPINQDLIGYRVRYMIRTNSYFLDLQRAEKELEKKIVLIQNYAQAASRFVPQAFLKILKKESITEIKIGDCTEQEMSVLFLDIRSFTTLSEKSTPAEIFILLNSLMDCLDPAIIKNNGFIDKYIGDALMALFTNPNDAVQAAIDMQANLKMFNEKRALDRLPPLAVGIGINSGSLLLGTVGFKDRMDCSVISDAVNVASRVETLTRVYGADILISEQTYQRIEADKFLSRSLGYTTVKGKIQPIKIYEIFSHNSPEEIQWKKEYSALFDQAVSRFEEKNYLEASSLFRQIISKNPRDLPAEYFFQHCQFKA
jgi:adenylate cyclase